MLKDNKILIGKSGDEEIYIYPKMANRHGLIAGATGTGKTMTLRVLAESFSDMGVPVFLADAKGDLSCLGFKGEAKGTVAERVEKLGLSDFEYKAFPVSIWDVYGKNGIPLRTTVSEMGPVLLSRILDLNDTQSEILNIIFAIADKEGLILTDTKDLKSMINYVSEKSKEYSQEYGNIAKQSLSAILRSVVTLESMGGELFFAEPALDLHDWIRTDTSGRGCIEVLDCRELMLSPVMYATFLLWLISELFEMLPEAGDLEKPKMVFFFDEAHMLFSGAPKVLLEKITQLVKLIRSKGVGIFFITQNPTDIPDEVLSQLGNKVQHALRAYTPAEIKKQNAAAQSYRENPGFKTAEVLSQLGTGEALISVLGEDGVPTVVERAFIVPPQSRTGALEEHERKNAVANDLFFSKYGSPVDNFTAFEFLERRRVQIDEQGRKAIEDAENEKQKAKFEKEKNKALQSVGKTAAGTVGREVGGTLGGAFGGKFGKKLGANLGGSIGRGLLATLFSRK